MQNCKSCIWGIILFLFLLPASGFAGGEKTVQENDTVAKTAMQADGITRLSRIEVDPKFLDEYLKYAVEVGQTSLLTEPGVLAMYSMQQKDKPNLITILEIYASQDAYKKHIASPHFQKYKQGTLKMVKNLELLDQQPLNPVSKIRNYIEEK